LAYDENIKGKRPGVLVVHEWWGLNEYARKRARMLAELGYSALAVDMFGEGKQAMHPDDAGKFSSELMKNFDVAKARFVAAMDFLKQQLPPTLHVLRRLAIVSGAGSSSSGQGRHGSQGSCKLSWEFEECQACPTCNVKAKVLVLHGADDKLSLRIRLRHSSRR